MRASVPFMAAVMAALSPMHFRALGGDRAAASQRVVRDPGALADWRPAPVGRRQARRHAARQQAKARKEPSPGWVKRARRLAGR